MDSTPRDWRSNAGLAMGTSNKAFGLPGVGNGTSVGSKIPRCVEGEVGVPSYTTRS